MTTDNLDKAFNAIPRREFLPDEVKDMADIDAPVPIGFGQTNSQPYTVMLMLTWLDPESGNKVLDVGSGSGWTAALLAYLVGLSGKVYAVEKIPELVKFGAENCRRLGIKNVRFFKAGSRYGLPRFAPYDRILVSAAASKMPQDILDQLNVGGRLVVPIRDSVHVIEKTSDRTGDYTDFSYSGFAFVPLA